VRYSNLKVLSMSLIYKMKSVRYWLWLDWNNETLGKWLVCDDFPLSMYEKQAKEMLLCSFRHNWKIPEIKHRYRDYLDKLALKVRHCEKIKRCDRLIAQAMIFSLVKLKDVREGECMMMLKEKKRKRKTRGKCRLIKNS